MPRIQNQKQRIIQVYRLLYEHNKLTMDEILEHLEDMGIYTERRTIYDDIKILNSTFPDTNGDNSEFNIVIEKNRHKPVSYYLKNRELSPAELELVKDSVKAFRFASISQTNELLKKLDKLRAGASSTNTPSSDIPDYARNKDDVTLSNINTIKYAINEDVCISAENRYHSLMPHTDDSISDKLKGQRRNWLSPFSVIFADGYYHLIAVSYSDKEDEREIVRYRIDRLKDIKLHPRTRRQGHRLIEVSEKSGLAEQYLSIEEKKSEHLRLCFKKDLVDAVMERFGRDLDIQKSGTQYLETYVPVVVDDEFMGWLFSFGKQMYVKSPYSVVTGIKKYLGDMRRMYK
ncbi:WYL domain-containing protein [Christensenellaceae bacterium OttesenSCG-928-K19]|nr:WYL domain-containing protein [Christensenellaceae bacterium OttesenSCG-928-K19]